VIWEYKLMLTAAIVLLVSAVSAGLCFDTEHKIAGKVLSWVALVALAILVLTMIELIWARNPLPPQPPAQLEKPK